MNRTPEDEFYSSLIKTIAVFALLVLVVSLGIKADEYLTEKGYMEWVK